MQAVFLDKGTFSDNIDLPAPAGVTDYITYDDTPQELIIERCQNADIIFSTILRYITSQVTRSKACPSIPLC